jgi:hypothetical protein
MILKNREIVYFNHQLLKNLKLIEFDETSQAETQKMV